MDVNYRIEQFIHLDIETNYWLNYMIIQPDVYLS
jgi:hypothetical protein